MASKKFFEEQREWSARKHHILTGYLKPFCQALSGQIQSGSNSYIYYVDCFAGAGSYKSEDGSAVEMGSPVLAAQVAQSLPYAIKCINIESNAQHFASLVKNTEAYSDIVTNVQGTIDEHLNNILMQVGSDPAFFFLDPFGIIDIPIAGLVDAIAQRPAITDALIRYDPTIVRRLCGRALQDPKRGRADAANLDRIFAGTDWRDILNEVSESTELDHGLLSLYASRLIHMSGSRFKFAASYALRTLEDKLKYFLIFATGNKLGVKIMSKILYSAEEEFIDKKAAAVQVHQLSLFGEPTGEELFSLKIDEIAASIKKVGAEKGSWTYDDLYYELILFRDWFGRITDRLFRRACKKLEQEGKLIKGPGPWNSNTRLTIKP